MPAPSWRWNCPQGHATPDDNRAGRQTITTEKDHDRRFDGGASARLYSQTPFDERGNFHYEGDLYRTGDNLATLAARIEAHLKTKFPIRASRS
jgi:hypothetical protein